MLTLCRQPPVVSAYWSNVAGDESAVTTIKLIRYSYLKYLYIVIHFVSITL